jgi:hypothetical protein
VSKKKHPRLPVAHAFGPAYGKWLDLWEGYEDYVAERIPLRKLKSFTYNDEVFDFTAPVIERDGKLVAGDYERGIYTGLFKIWAGNAASLRSSFKFKIEETQWMGSPLWSADNIEVTTYLPFENVYIQYEADGGRAILALCERRTLGRDYPEMGLLAGETFICLTPAGYNTNGLKGAPKEKLGCYPIEIHFREGVEWAGSVNNVELEWSCSAEDGNEYPPILEATPPGVETKNWKLQNHSGPYMNALFALLAMLSSGGVKQTNHGKVKPENVIRRKPLHKKQHPMYEYRVLELGLGDEEPIVNVQIPRECAKKRLHAVRGFFRHYKNPIKSGPNKGKTKVLVKEHWRGDKELGVVRKDYIFVNSSELPETVC